MSFEEFFNGRSGYLHYLYDFMEKVRSSEKSFADIASEAGGAEHVACLTVDAVKGFCSEGVMSSPQMKAVVPNIAACVKGAAECGAGQLIFTCDSHEADSPEFQSWPAHCIKGTSESELEDELTSLECSGSFKIIPKPAISSFVDTTLLQTLRSHTELNTFIVMGGVTDLCLYHLVAGLRFFSVSGRHGWRVIVPENAAATFDMDCRSAEKCGGVPHDEKLLHAVFLEHMQTLGAEITGRITF